MDAGRLDQQIAIETRSVIPDESGAEVESWATTAHPWARVIETPGREFLQGDVQAEGKAVFVIRWRDMDSSARVVWRGRNYTIEDVTGTRREGYSWLHCRSVAGVN